MLKIQYKDGSREPVLLTEPGKTIGKGTINDIVVDQEGVNNFHADLKVEGDKVTLSDVNTKSGTFLNGDRLSGPTQVRAGDVIRVGETEFEIIDAAAATDGKTLVLSGSALAEMGIGGWALVADSGPEKGQVIGINEKITIGRALDCDLCVLEPGLSRRHAEVEIVEGEMWVRDLGSANGTFINKKQINIAQAKDGDRIQFENVAFVVRGP